MTSGQVIYESCLTGQDFRQQGGTEHRDSEHNQDSVDSKHKKGQEKRECWVFNIQS